MKLSRQLDPCIFSASEIAARIDHAVLRPWSTRDELERAIEELERLSLRCLILSPTLLYEARSLTRKCLGAVAGFPYGYHTVEAKIKEVEDLVAMGADEIDFVANLQLALLGKIDQYVNEIKAVTTICRDANVKCKIIIEAPALSPSLLQKVVAAIVESTEPDYIKTSTGFGPRHTIPDDIILIDKVLREKNVRSRIGIKAAGGIRQGLQASILLQLGADIIGTSTPSKIIESYKEACAK
jgi:deoxyribose-phosphate aldolase